ncbi:hypothetical protein BBD41_13600 [Paenibacillus ihbetae]|uniref:Uncharacterized protein n=1 Tax=Paenibacillus ihbetae TaxID=1870820 RepID=A0A1B2E0I6_9BACL|nr:hypothetical protein BBD41_13600 [Paenibacillus ihbetae]OOC52364.1 hypothetical protein BBD40_28965 [Paenibacillus ihbetae]
MFILTRFPQIHQRGPTKSTARFPKGERADLRPITNRPRLFDSAIHPGGHDKRTDLAIMRIRAGTGSDTFILVFCKDYIQIDHEVLEKTSL